MGSAMGVSSSNRSLHLAFPAAAAAAAAAGDDEKDGRPSHGFCSFKIQLQNMNSQEHTHTHACTPAQLSS